MTLLKLGIVLWVVAHGFGRLAPGLRARLGEPGKGLVSLGVLVGIVLMVIGYRSADTIVVYIPPAWGVHANNLLMLIAFYLFVVSGTKTQLARHIRHPQLTGLMLWAVGHLLANGDHASLILFGGMFVWSLGMVFLINLQEPEWDRPARLPIGKEVRAAGAAVILFAAVAGIHSLLGYDPFPA